MSERTTMINGGRATRAQLLAALAALDDRYVRLKMSNVTEEDALDRALVAAGYPEDAIQTAYMGGDSRLTGKGLWLNSDDYDWAIENDEGELVLTCKEKA